MCKSVVAAQLVVLATSNLCGDVRTDCYAGTSADNEGIELLVQKQNTSIENKSEDGNVWMNYNSFSLLS